MTILPVLHSTVFLSFLAGVQGVPQLTWLPCQFIEERVSVRGENEKHTDLVHRDAMLQFGQKGDAPVNPRSITFLVTGKKLQWSNFHGNSCAPLTPHYHPSIFSRLEAGRVALHRGNQPREL